MKMSKLVDELGGGASSDGLTTDMETRDDSTLCSVAVLCAVCCVGEVWV